MDSRSKRKLTSAALILTCFFSSLSATSGVNKNAEDIITDPVYQSESGYPDKGPYQLSSLTIGVSPSAVVCQGETVVFRAFPDSNWNNPHYSWEVNGTAAGNNDSVFTMIPANGDFVTCTLLENMAVSNAIIITVNPLPANIHDTIKININNGLTGYYPFNGNANDESGNGNNGASANAVLTTDRFGLSNSAYYFDGLVSSVVTADDAFDFPVSPFSFCLWALWDADPALGSHLFDKQGYPLNHGNGYRLYTGGSGQLWFSFSSNPTWKEYGSTFIPQTGKWYFITVVNDDSLKVFVNCNKIIGDTTARIIGNDSLLTFGKRVDLSGISQLKGKLDDIRIYNRALSESELKIISNDKQKLDVLITENNLCQNNGTTIKIINPQFGILYQLYKDGYVADSAKSVNCFCDTLTFSTGILSTTTSFTITATNILSGCNITLDTTLIVVIFQLPEPTITGNNSICEGSSGNIYITEPGMTQYVWEVSSGGIITSGGTPSSNTAVITWNSSGNQSVSINYLNSNSCSAPTASIKNIIVNPLPVITSSIPCFDTIITTDCKPFHLNGGFNTTYSGIGVYNGILYPSLSGAGNFSITFSASSSFGCTKVKTINIHVANPSPFVCGSNLNDIRNSRNYPTVQIGTQCWLAENLEYGSFIPKSLMAADNCLAEKFCYEDNPVSCNSRGGLYQWDEIMKYESDTIFQDICPFGWHVPTRYDWEVLFNFYGSSAFAATPLKTGGITGFNAYLSGVLFHNNTYTFEGFATYFWSSTAFSQTDALALGMNFFETGFSFYPSFRNNAYYVRCLKN